MGFKKPAILALLLLNFNIAFCACPQKEFPPFLGETLSYEIYWGFINVGSAEIKISELVEISSSCAYKITSWAKSGSFIENFYKVKDYNEAWLDINLARSYGYKKDIKEGGYAKKETVVYDYDKKLFFAETQNKKGETKTSQGELEGDVFDVFSSLYIARTLHKSPEKEFKMKVNTKKNWELKIIKHKSEKIETPAGKFKCDVMEPIVGTEGIFVPKEGKKLLVYISKDTGIPVMLKAEIFIGSVSAKLSKYIKNP